MIETYVDAKLSLENMTWTAVPVAASADAPPVDFRAHACDRPEDTFLHAWATMQLYGLELMQPADARHQPVPNRTLPERLAALLVDLGAKQGGIIRDVSHQSLAERLGTERETVAALIRAFHRQGMIHFGYRRIEVLDPAALAELAW